MDVAVTDLRAHLSEWLDRVRDGDEVVITDRGVPVARLVGLTTTATLERLTAEGVIGRPATARRPRASGRPRARTRLVPAFTVPDHAAMGLGRPQRCWRSLRMRAHSRRWAARTPGWRAVAVRHAR